MRRSKTAVLAAKKAPVAGRDETAVRLVCLALALSFVMLACRIVSIW